MDSHGSSGVTAVGPCVYSIWRRKLPSNLLSQVYIKQIRTPHPEPLLWGTGKGLHTHLFTCTLGERRMQRTVPTLPGNHWSFANTEFTTTLETERRGSSHSIWHVVPSIVPFEILWVGGEAICRVGWYFSFMQMHHCWKTLLFITFEIPKGKRLCLPSLLYMMPNTLWMVNKCHIVFILHWPGMTFFYESCLLRWLSKSHKVHTYPKKKALLKVSLPYLNLFPKFPLMFHSPLSWDTHLFRLATPHLFYTLFPLPPAEPTCKSLTLYFISFPSQNGNPLFYIYFMTLLGKPLMRLIIWAITNMDIFGRKFLFL